MFWCRMSVCPSVDRRCHKSLARLAAPRLPFRAPGTTLSDDDYDNNYDYDDDMMHEENGQSSITMLQ